MVSDVTRMLEASGWTVDHNRYYLSDQSDVFSALDIVAVKSESVGWCDYETEVNTVLLISCKKPNNYAWGLLTRDKHSDDVDVKWVGTSFWTNTSYFRYQMDTQVINHDYLADLAKSKLQGSTVLADKQIFALQEIDEDSGTQNDERRIAESIHELVRARRYEMSILQDQTKHDTVFNFNLISVVDTKLLEINLMDKALDIRELREAGYVGKFVLDSGETAAGITFVEAKHFQECLDRYNKIHAANCAYVKRKDQGFYTDIVKDPKRIRYLLRVLSRRIREALHKQGYLPRVTESRDMRIWNIRWDEKYEQLVIDIESSEIRPEVLNGDLELAEMLDKVLLDILRYKGKFRFDLFIPF